MIGRDRIARAVRAGKPVFAVALLVAVAGAVLLPVEISSAEKTKDRKRSITVDELRKLQVIGRLGQPLGGIVTIEGVVADDSYTNSKADSGQTLLRVQTAGGKSLVEEQVYHFRPFLNRLDEPKVGAGSSMSGTRPENTWECPGRHSTTCPP